TDERGSCIAEQKLDHPAFSVDPGAVAGSDRPTDARRDVGVEPHLAFAETQSKTRLPTRPVGGRDLEHHRTGAGSPSCVRRGDAVTLAYLAGTDPLGAEPFDGA